MACLLEVAHHCEKFLGIFLLTLILVYVLHSLFSMAGSEVELVSNSITSKETSVAVPVNQKEEKPTSLKTLFFRFSSTKERVILFLGFFFAVFGGVLIPLSYTFYGDLMNTLIQKPLEVSVVVKVISLFALFMGSSAVLAFFERLCLSYFAGNVDEYL